MLLLIVLSVAVAAVAGLAVKHLLDKSRHDLEITWNEFAVAMAIIACVVAPAVTHFGWEASRSNLVTFNEYRNGWELLAIRTDIPCSRDGPCTREYDCDPYTVMVPYTCNCDSKGNNCSTCYRQETHYHSCPYVDVETTYSIETTLGRYEISQHRLPENPERRRWGNPWRVDGYKLAIPQHVIQNAGTGIPRFWAEAKARIDSGSPGHVTKRAEYVNYILSSDRTILKQYSGDIQKFRAAGLLPPVQAGIHDFYLADKVHFVGFNPGDSRAWQDSLSYLNAGFGTELEGDVHMVIVRSDAVSANPDTYALALKAHWQDTKTFGKDALSKNGTVVVIGAGRDGAVTWAKAFTGMPMGNESTLVALEHGLKGLPLSPMTIIGEVRGKFVEGRKVAAGNLGGPIAAALWGTKNAGTRFSRVSMTGKGSSKNGMGFAYLFFEIEPTSGQKAWILVFTFLGCCAVWTAVAFIGRRERWRH